MRICYLAAADSIHSYRWVRHFAMAGHHVTWISLAASIFDPLPGVRFHHLRCRGGFDLPAIGCRVAHIVSRTSPDVVHVHSVGTYGLLGLFVRGVPIVATPWGSDVLFGKQSPFKRPIIRRVLQRATLVTCDAWHMRSEVMRLGVPARRIHLVNFGIDCHRFAPHGRDPVIRQSFRLGEDLAVVSLRNFEPVYDLATLLRAVPQVLATYPRVRFLLVGKGSLLEQLQAQVRALGIQGAVSFVGFVPNDRLPATLSSLDVYVSTSLSDAGIAASTAEAMACGLPVVVSDSGENTRWISDGINGMVFRPGDEDGLAQALIRLLGDPAQCQRLGQAGRQTICERNDHQREMARMGCLYETCRRARPERCA